MLLFFLFLNFAISLVWAQEPELQTCQASMNNTCFQKCFDTPDNSSMQSYTELCNMVQVARRARMESDPNGTITFAFDLTENNTDVQEYQRNLASILSLVLTNGSNNTSSLFFADYFNMTVNVNSSSSCLDSCSAAQYAQSEHFIPQNTSVNDQLDKVCTWAPTTEPNVTCSNNNNNNNNAANSNMLVVLRNSPVRTTQLAKCEKYGKRLLISLRPWLGIPKTLMVTESIETESSTDKLRVSRELMTCMQQSCGCVSLSPSTTTTISTTINNNSTITTTTITGNTTIVTTTTSNNNITTVTTATTTSSKGSKAGGAGMKVAVQPFLLCLVILAMRNIN